jgi:hypothetical protein
MLGILVTLPLPLGTISIMGMIPGKTCNIPLHLY